MNKSVQKIEIISPLNQLNLYGYSRYFKTFIELYSKKLLPQVSLITGSKGLGKSTFIYHFINYLLSKNEDHSYSLKDNIINLDNRSYKLVTSNIHPNFVSISKKNDQKEISIEDIRKLKSFLNKSTFSNDIKYVLIDNPENFNINSSNALLKTLEEPAKNTFFFIICNNVLRIPQTLKSRSIEFKIFFNQNEKEKIFLNLAKDYDSEVQINNISDFLFFDTPGNFLRYSSHVELNDKNTLKNISLFMDKYITSKDPENLSIVTLFVEIFYKNLFFLNPYNLMQLSFNKSKILNKINLLKIFNLDPKDTFFYIQNVLKNEER